MKLIVYYLISVLLFVSSCATKEVVRKEDLPKYIPQRKTTKTIGLNADTLSLSVVNSKSITNRSDYLSSFRDSVSLLSELMLVQFLSKSSINESHKILNNIAKETLIKNINAHVPDDALYNYILLCLRRKNYHQINYLLAKLFQSKSKIFQARAYNIKSILELESLRVPEAVANLKASYKLNKSDSSVLLNLGLINLKYGFFDEAKKHLNYVRNHPLAAYMLLLIYQVTNNKIVSLSMCSSYISKYPNNKIFLFNCGKIAYQYYKKFEVAKTWLLSSMRIKSKYKKIDVEARRIIQAINSRNDSKSK